MEPARYVQVGLPATQTSRYLLTGKLPRTHTQTSLARKQADIFGRPDPLQERRTDAEAASGVI